MQFSLEPLYLAIPPLSPLRHISFLCFIAVLPTNTHAYIAFNIFSLQWSVFSVPEIIVLLFYSLEPLYLAILLFPSFDISLSFTLSLYSFATDTQEYICYSSIFHPFNCRSSILFYRATPFCCSSIFPPSTYLFPLLYRCVAHKHIRIHCFSYLFPPLICLFRPWNCVLLFFSIEPLHFAIPPLSLLWHISFFCSITIFVTYTQTLVIPLFSVPSIDVFLLFSIEQLSLAIPPLSLLRHISFLHSIAIFATDTQTHLLFL